MNRSGPSGPRARHRGRAWVRCTRTARAAEARGSGTGPSAGADWRESGVVVSAVRCVSHVSVCLVDYINTSSCQDAKGLLDLDP